MKRAPRQPWQPRSELRPSELTPFLPSVAVLLATSVSPAIGQDIRGMEVCTAEKQMERRTSCLQADVEYLQQALIKLDREMHDKTAVADRDLTEARAEITALKSKVEQLNSELAQMKAKAEPNAKK
jgi:predicted RNase H-like nuclease (RuvC/YqgF family)